MIGSHFGFGHNPAVIWAIADRLAQPSGQWAPFRPPAMLRPLFPRPHTAREHHALRQAQSRLA